MFLIVTWIFFGVAVGCMGLGALAGAASSSRGDIGGAVAVVLFGAMLGAAAGGALGWTFNQKFAGDKRKLNWLAAGPWIGTAVLVLGFVMFERIREDMRNPDLVRPDGRGLSLIYEIRLPAGVPAPARSFSIELQSPEETKRADSADVVRKDGDRVVIQGHFYVYKASPKRVVAFRLGDGPATLFTMHLAARPAARGGRWSSWQESDQSGPRPPRAPDPNETFEIRYAANH